MFASAMVLAGVLRHRIVESTVPSGHVVLWRASSFDLGSIRSGVLAMLLTHKLLLIAAAGGLGALARYGLSGVILRATGTGFPYGTWWSMSWGAFSSVLSGRWPLSGWR
jgi:hypothetical protein